MSDRAPVVPQTPPPLPFVTVREEAGQTRIETNLPPAMRPLLLWMLERAKLTILTTPSEQEKPKIVPANGSISGLMKRMRHG